MGRTHYLLLCALVLATAVPSGAADHVDRPKERRVPVETTQVEKRVFKDRLVVQGNLESRNIAVVPARIPGTLMELYVGEGDSVQAGKTALLLTDDLKLRKAVELRKLDLAVSHCGVLEKQANLEREKAALERADKDFKRQGRLFNQEKIGTLDAVEEAEAEYKKAVAEVKHAESLVALAKEQEHQAAANVDMSQKDLSDATVMAPISGVVSRRFQDVGEMGGPAQPVFRIEDVSQIEVSVFLPARHYGGIKVGETRMQVSLEQQPIGEFPVSYRSPTIDPRIRVFEVKCLLPKPVPGAVPGAMATVGVVLRREEGLGLPKKSLVNRAGAQVVFVTEDGRAKAVTVETGLETDGWVVVKGEGLQAGIPVVVRGQFLLNDKTALDVRTGAAPAAAPGNADIPAALNAQVRIGLGNQKDN
jgi:multidrug efflux pump subunit AcrA (membrane-fusion protein)